MTSWADVKDTFTDVTPKAMKRLHLGLTYFWLAIWIAAGIFGWLASVTFVSHLSAAALVLTSWGAWQGARAEEKADSDCAACAARSDAVDS
jgi:uncharacterized protein (DUF58 family)